MVFPDTERVIYKNNTLKEVVCQVKFPAILRISSQAPAEFQERIRGQFPLFETKPAMELPADVPPEMTKLISSKMGNVAHFISRDRYWRVALFKDFLALTCSSYVHWEDFKSHFGGPFEALAEIYAPSFYTRIGLRYINIIERNELGVSQVPWPRLLRPEICGELADPQIGPSIVQSSRELALTIDDSSKIRLAHGIGEQPDSYVIDADFFTERETEVADVWSQIDSFNRESFNLFRWAITPELHAAMGPTESD